VKHSYLFSSTNRSDYHDIAKCTQKKTFDQYKLFEKATEMAVGYESAQVCKFLFTTF
jgi:hypothetical protein